MPEGIREGGREEVEEWERSVLCEVRGVENDEQKRNRELKSC